MDTFDKVTNETGKTEGIEKLINASSKDTNENLLEDLQPSKEAIEAYDKKVIAIKKRATELYISNKVLQRV